MKREMMLDKVSEYVTTGTSNVTENNCKKSISVMIYLYRT